MNPIIIDRRLNPSGRSLPNRQYLARRARDEIKRAVEDFLDKAKGVSDAMDTDGKISISLGGIEEPTIEIGSGGKTNRVFPGNKEFAGGEILERPSGGSGSGTKGKAGEGRSDQDQFEFVLTREEFLDAFFGNLELPELQKKNIMDMVSDGYHRAGFTRTGSPSALSLKRTALNAMGRRLALHRPKKTDIEALEREIENTDDATEREKLIQRLEALKKRHRAIPYIDPFDERYRRLEQNRKPNTQAVMFCLMDVSGSMTEHMKDLAKRFFMLLGIFLMRKYKKVEIVYIRHTETAQEVDEETFFHSKDTGGTVISSALVSADDIIDERYPPEHWNIYIAQASDGDNLPSDENMVIRCITALLPKVQYYAYIDVHSGAPNAKKNKSILWRIYEVLIKSGLPIAMQKVGDKSQIFKVFAELFQRGRKKADALKEGG